MSRSVGLACAVLILGLLAPLGAGACKAAAAKSVGGSAWAGFVVDDSSPHTLITASSNWVVPLTKCAKAGSSKAAEWVGLGGDGNLPNFEPLYQAGIDTDCDRGTQDDYAWAGVYAPDSEKPTPVLGGKSPSLWYPSTRCR